MQVIRESAEHHFLTTLEKLKKNPKGWVALHFALSKQCDHEDLITDAVDIQNKIRNFREQAEAFLNQCVDHASVLEKGFLYLFPDNDIVLLAYAGDEKDNNKTGLCS